MNLPDEFVNSINTSLTSSEADDFFRSLGYSSPVSIRINPNKWKLDLPESSVPWCTLGYYLNRRPIFTLDPAFHAGAYYVQEPSSMVIHHILNQLPLNKKRLKILDLCASPGGKSTLIASWLNGSGLLVANEIIKNRAYTLKYNLSKEGHSNVLVSNNNPEDFKNLTGIFDIILVDAPCSGEGMFRKDPNAIGEWSTGNVQNCSNRQQKIIKDILPSLAQDGYLIYSTCTFNDFENINNSDHIVSKHNFQNITIPFPTEWGVTTKSGKRSIGYQFYPHKLNGEGFFVSIFKNMTETNPNNIKNKSATSSLKISDKSETSVIKEWIQDKNLVFRKDKAGTFHAIPIVHEEDFLLFENQLHLVYCGISVGIVNKNILIPDHSLALSYILKKDFPTFELSHDEALLYLKKSLNQINSDQKSWVLATFQGNGIGFLKNLGNRINNYLPVELRINMELPRVTS